MFLLSPALAPKMIASAKVIAPMCESECVMCSLTNYHAHRLISTELITLPNRYTDQVANLPIFVS